MEGLKPPASAYSKMLDNSIYEAFEFAAATLWRIELS